MSRYSIHILNEVLHLLGTTLIERFLARSSPFRPMVTLNSEEKICINMIFIDKLIWTEAAQSLWVCSRKISPVNVCLVVYASICFTYWLKNLVGSSSEYSTLFLHICSLWGILKITNTICCFCCCLVEVDTFSRYFKKHLLKL